MRSTTLQPSIRKERLTTTNTSSPSAETCSTVDARCRDANWWLITRSEVPSTESTEMMYGFAPQSTIPLFLCSSQPALDPMNESVAVAKIARNTGWPPTLSKESGSSTTLNRRHWQSQRRQRSEPTSWDDRQLNGKRMMKVVPLLKCELMRMAPRCRSTAVLPRPYRRHDQKRSKASLVEKPGNQIPVGGFRLCRFVIVRIGEILFTQTIGVHTLAIGDFDHDAARFLPCFTKSSPAVAC